MGQSPRKRCVQHMILSGNSPLVLKVTSCSLVQFSLSPSVLISRLLHSRQNLGILCIALTRPEINLFMDLYVLDKYSFNHVIRLISRQHM